MQHLVSAVSLWSPGQNKLRMSVGMLGIASFPGCCVLRFMLTIIHRCGRATKNGEGLVSFITCFMSSGRRGEGATTNKFKTADEVV